MNNSLKVRYRGFIIACVSMLFSYSYGDGDLEARLWQAAKTDNSCKPITYRGMNADLYNEYGQTPVMIAAEMNNSRFIDCLMEADVDVTIADNYGRTAFDYVKNPQSKPNEEYSVKTYSALQKLEVHQLIGDTVRITKEEFDYKKYTYTIWIEGALCQEFLIPEGIKCFEKEKINRTDTASMIFDKDVNRGVPPLFAAIQNRSYETLLDILDDGTDVNMKFKRVLPLMHAIYQNDDKLVEILLKYGANPNF
ncbi:MAG TPA: ankyrin repeat domain-containing protein, partial [Epsilonproteobacteria bacterium]|nr:ankyrin repeat domain-containing protein [Campylobacterota bacterium]